MMMGGRLTPIGQYTAVKGNIYALGPGVTDVVRTFPFWSTSSSSQCGRNTLDPPFLASSIGCVELHHFIFSIFFHPFILVSPAFPQHRYSVAGVWTSIPSEGCGDRPPAARLHVKYLDHSNHVPCIPRMPCVVLS